MQRDIKLYLCIFWKAVSSGEQLKQGGKVNALLKLLTKPDELLNKAAKVLRIIPAVDSGAAPIISRNYYAVLFSSSRIARTH
jgi:hypothetical protein